MPQEFRTKSILGLKKKGIKMFTKNNNDSSLAEELPYWDFIDGAKPHAVLVDGSLVAGLKVSLVDIECLDAGEINQFTSGLRSALNSISEGTNLQFVLSVRSDFSEMIDTHSNSKRVDIHPLVNRIAEYRETKLKTALENSELYRPQLYLYVRTPMVTAKKSGIFKKVEVFSDKANEAYVDTLEVLAQNIDTLTTSLNGIGLDCDLMSKEEILTHIYQFLNPKRSKDEPTPKVTTGIFQDRCRVVFHDAC
jgi:type IV secretory pathway VirB4 component